MTTRKKLSSVEIQSADFKRSFRGFDREEVKLFLEAVGESYQAMTLENQNLTSELARMKASLDEFKKREDILREALYSAQKMADEVKTQAAREAQNIVQGAELKGETLVREAQLRAHEIERSIVDLKMERDRALDSIRDLVSHVTGIIEVSSRDREKENVTTFGKDSQ
jgi:cell division initiation protein